MKKLIVIFLTLLLTACNTTTSTTKEQALHFGMTSSIEHFNPILTEDGHSELISLVYRGLMKQTENNEVVGDLAKNFVVSEDELQYTFTLQKASWHDREPITAKDVVYTIEEILKKENASPYYSDFQTVKTVEAIDKETVKITLREQTPTLLNKLKVGIIPKHIYEKEDLLTAKANKNPIGNGPYKLTEWLADDVLTFEVNEAFYGQTPSISKLVVYTKLDENTKLLRLQTGDLHITQITPKQMTTVEKIKTYQIKQLPTADYRALQFNQQHEQLSDVRVRTAINHFIDREQIQKLVLQNSGELAYGPLQRSFARYDSKAYRLDVEKAEQLLAEAGYQKQKKYYEKNRQALQFEVVAPVTDPIRVAMATVIVEQLNVHGIKAQLQTKDWANIVIEKEDTFMIGWGSEDDPDTHTYRVFHSSEHAPVGYNYALVSNEKIDRALETAKMGSKHDRAEAYITFQKELEQEMAFSFLLYLDGIYAVANGLHGIRDKTLGHNGFGLFWNIEYWEWEDEDV